MSRESFVFILGLAIFFIPFLGVPSDWKERMFIGAGIILMVVGYSLRRSAFLRSIQHESGEHRSDAFVERPHVTAPIEQKEVLE